MSEKLDKIITEIDNLTVLELAELVKTLKERYGITDAPVAVSVPTAQVEVKEEQTEFSVILVSCDPTKKINCIKAIRESTSLGLLDSKNLVTEAPKTVKENLSKEDAQKLKKLLEDAGGTVEIK